jgi:hypothetical protein
MDKRTDIQTHNTDFAFYILDMYQVRISLAIFHPTKGESRVQINLLKQSFIILKEVDRSSNKNAGEKNLNSKLVGADGWRMDPLDLPHRLQRHI